MMPLELRLEQPDDFTMPGAPPPPPQQPWYANPYTAEISAFVPSEAQLAAGRERLYPPLHATACTWVETEAGLQAMMRRLSTANEIAIDLESHSYRSYRGFVCVMQISTRDEDFLVDAIELRGALHVLNDLFTNPRVTKVMHGADSDVNWLQRDFGLYIVGLFDTGQAARVLEFSSFALAHLLKHYCGVTANKAFQMADWRIRPLTEEMLTYAREDTHYLLYIYDRIKNDLAQHGRTPAVWQRSAELCRQAYKVLPFDPDAHLVVARRQNVTLSPHQLAVHRVLFAWRDAVAREEDESPAYVLPNHLLTRLATGMPQTPEQLHAVCHPLPPLLHYRASSLLAAIAGAQAPPNATGYYARGRGNQAPPPPLPPPLPAMSGPMSGTAAGASSNAALLAAAGASSCAPMHPMQPSLIPPSAKPGAHPSAMLPGAMPPCPPMGASAASSAAAPPATFAGAAAGASGASGRVRCPPAPTRSPPLPPEQVYTAAGWVPGAEEQVPVPGGRAASLGADNTNGIFFGWSSGSSADEEENDEHEDAQSAKAVQQQLNASPLWVLGMFTPAGSGAMGAPGYVTAGASCSSGATGEGVGGEPSAVPRSLTEIYKLSNQNKRRGAAVRRPSEEVPPPVDDAKDAEDEDESSDDGGGEELADDEDGDDDDDDDGDGSKRRRPGGEGGEAWGGESSAVATEEFMRRIGWLQGNAEMPTGGGELGIQQGGAAMGGGAGPAREGLGGTYMPSTDRMDAPPLPFQRQLPPHMPGGPGGPGMRPNAPPHQAPHGMPQGPPAAPLHGLLAAEHRPRCEHNQSHAAMPPPPLASAPMLPMGAQGADPDGKKSSRPRHKKRAGSGSGEFSGEFDYSQADSQFVFGAPPGGMGKGGKGGKGEYGGKGKGGGRLPPPPAAGNRSMSFTPGGGKGGGGRRY